MTPIAPGPPRSSVALMAPRRGREGVGPAGPRRAASPARTSGSPRRSSLLTASKPKRPLSQSQPQLTGSTSTPTVAQHLVAATTATDDAAADRARRCRWTRPGLEVPRAGLEAVGLRGERADRADLHGVAAEVRRERLVGEGVDLGVVAAVEEVDQRVAGHLLGEPGAAVAEDAALAVEVDEVADRDRLLVVPLLLDEAALARAVGHGLVLQRALAALVAHRAVERVVDQQELEDAVLGLLGDRRTRCRPSCPGVHSSMQLGCSAGPRPVSTSTRHMRHMPTGFIRGW